MHVLKRWQEAGYAALEALLEHMDMSAAAGVVQFELMLLAELGFGLELDACAATGHHREEGAET